MVKLQHRYDAQLDVHDLQRRDLKLATQHTPPQYPTPKRLLELRPGVLHRFGTPLYGLCCRSAASLIPSH